MLPPPVTGGGPGLLRVAAAMGRELLLQKARQVLDDLGHEKAGFAYRALELHHQELLESGRNWNDEELRTFIEVRLPAAIEAAEKHAALRGGECDAVGDQHA